MITETGKEIHNLCIAKNITFATFRMPMKKVTKTYIQKSPESIEFKELNEIEDRDGFIMAPFDTRNGKRYILVEPDLVSVPGSNDGEILEKVKRLPANPEPNWDGDEPMVIKKEDYLEQVENIRENISRGVFQKSVLSRIKLVKGDFISRITNIFDELCRTHPNAFVYMFKSEGHFWIGASPEPLLRIRDGILSTVSLAGTRSYSDENMILSNWNAKEVLEQEYVTRYIHDNFRAFSFKDYRVTSPYVKKAGDLVHLRTDFAYRMEESRDKIWDFLNSLHPTPAVAGQPKDEAIDFIKKLEEHDREYYSGFLGPVSSRDQMDLFVNLRCIRIMPDYLSLFVGGGITLESDPEEEWEETELKAKSLLSIIHQLEPKKDDGIPIQTTHR